MSLCTQRAISKISHRASEAKRASDRATEDAGDVYVCVYMWMGDRVTLFRTSLVAVREGIYSQPDVGNCMTERRRKIRDKHSRQPQEPRFNINADGAPLPALITLHCASLAPSVIYIRLPRCRVMHIPVRISNVSVPTEAGTRTIHADGGERERGEGERNRGMRDGGEKRTETTRQADNGAFQNFGISGGSRCASGLALNTYSPDRSFVLFAPHISSIVSVRFF